MYQIKSPVLFTVFNRPDTTERVFERIRACKPPKLYIAADGPRSERAGEAALCEQTRNKINVDWDCEVFTLYRDENLGCKMAMSGAVKWFFQNEEEGIILEDDCLPDDGFFRFCDTLLEKYRHDTRVAHIAGTNLGMTKKYGNATYYFSRYTMIWGWASWRRVWENYDENLLLLDGFIEQDLFKYIYKKKAITDHLIKTLNVVKSNAIVTWDFQYIFMNFWNNSLCIVPNQNLISNIGFDTRATHTFDTRSKFANLPIDPLGEITHPKYFVPIIDADYDSLSLETPPLATKIRRLVVPMIKKIINYPRTLRSMVLGQVAT